MCFNQTDSWLVVRLGAAATEFLHKLQKAIPPWVPLRGREPKTYKQAQEEAYETKRCDLAVLRANDGIWPGVRIPSHCLFLWAGGSELTSILEADHMPNKYIPKDLRYWCHLIFYIVCLNHASFIIYISLLKRYVKWRVVATSRRKYYRLDMLF